MSDYLFKPGDPEPKEDVVAVMDSRGRVWRRDKEWTDYWNWDGNSLSWRGLLNGGSVIRAFSEPRCDLDSDPAGE